MPDPTHAKRPGPGLLTDGSIATTITGCTPQSGIHPFPASPTSRGITSRSRPRPQPLPPRARRARSSRVRRHSPVVPQTRPSTLRLEPTREFRVERSLPPLSVRCFGRYSSCRRYLQVGFGHAPGRCLPAPGHCCRWAVWAAATLLSSIRPTRGTAGLAQVRLSWHKRRRVWHRY